MDDTNNNTANEANGSKELSVLDHEFSPEEAARYEAQDQHNNLLHLTASIVASVGPNYLTMLGIRPQGEEVIGNLVRETYNALAGLEPATVDTSVDMPDDAADTGVQEGAVSVRKSLASPDHIISMIDGKPYKTLRRHLSTHGLTPDQYRARYGLKADYPMVSQSYSEARRDMAKKMGLGQRPGSASASVTGSTQSDQAPVDQAPQVEEQEVDEITEQADQNDTAPAQEADRAQ